MFSSIYRFFRSFFRASKKIVETATNENTVRIAVTGLSRAGKTVFITSLVQNLLASTGPHAALPDLVEQLSKDKKGGTGKNRLNKVRILPSGTSKIAHFDYESKFQALAADLPSWPSRTEDLSELALNIEIERREGWRKKLGTRRIRIELLDYPGEWLLDLPMLSKTYTEWSNETLARIRRPGRSDAYNTFLNYITGIRLDADADDAQIKPAHRLYKEALESSRKKSGLRYLQPGRFLCPGQRGDAPFLWFFPMDHTTGSPRAESTEALLRDRFETYKADMKSNFFDTYFTKFDRQVLLVDVLGALAAGKEAFEDTRETIYDITKSLSYGAGVIPKRLQDATRSKIFSLDTRRIERLAIVATKADHVPKLRRQNLKNLVEKLSRPGLPDSLLQKNQVSFHTVASINSTTDFIKMNTEGTLALECVAGLPLGEKLQRAFYPGDVPSEIPPESFWTNAFIDLPTFTPPSIDITGKNGIPNLELDNVVVSLLKDLLQ